MAGPEITEVINRAAHSVLDDLAPTTGSLNQRCSKLALL